MSFNNFDFRIMSALAGCSTNKRERVGGRSVGDWFCLLQWPNGGFGGAEGSEVDVSPERGPKLGIVERLRKTGSMRYDLLRKTLATLGPAAAQRAKKNQREEEKSEERQSGNSGSKNLSGGLESIWKKLSLMVHRPEERENTQFFSRGRIFPSEHSEKHRKTEKYASVNNPTVGKPQDAQENRKTYICKQSYGRKPARRTGKQETSICIRDICRNGKPRSLLQKKTKKINLHHL